MPVSVGNVTRAVDDANQSIEQIPALIGNVTEQELLYAIGVDLLWLRLHCTIPHTRTTPLISSGLDICSLYRFDVTVIVFSSGECGGKT